MTEALEFAWRWRCDEGEALPRAPLAPERYRVLERREDGTLVLQPHREKLSAVVEETDGQVFRDEEFIAHLERLEAAEDDLPAEAPPGGS